MARIGSGSVVLLHIISFKHTSEIDGTLVSNKVHVLTYIKISDVAIVSLHAKSLTRKSSVKDCTITTSYRITLTETWTHTTSFCVPIALASGIVIAVFVLTTI